MKEVLKNDYVLSLISKFCTVVFGFLSLIFLNRYLGVALKGEYSSILNYVSLVSIILQFGISNIYPRYKRKKIDNCYNVFISLSIIQFFLYLSCSLLLVMIFDSNYTFIWVCLISSVSILTTQLRYINLVENIRYNTIVVTLMSVSNFVFTIIAFLIIPRSLNTALIIYLLKDLVIVLFYIKKIDFRLIFKKEYIKLYGKILIDGFLPMASGLLIMLNYKIDILMLNSYKIDYSLIGLYSLGLSIAEYIWIIPDIFKDVVQKRTAKNNSIETINFSLRCSSTLVCLAYLLLLIVGKKFFGLIFGGEYIEAYNVTIILFLGIYSMVYYKIIGQLFISDNKSLQYFLILVFGAISNIVTNAILIPKYNIIGASIASIVSYSVIGIVFLILYKKQYNIKIKDILFVEKKDFQSFKEIGKKVKK